MHKLTPADARLIRAAHADRHLPDARLIARYVARRRQWPLRGEVVATHKVLDRRGRK